MLTTHPRLRLVNVVQDFNNRQRLIPRLPVSLVASRRCVAHWRKRMGNVAYRPTIQLFSAIGRSYGAQVGLRIELTVAVVVELRVEQPIPAHLDH